MTPKIIIEVKGGMVTTVLANTPIEYVLVDWDNINQGDDINNLVVMKPDAVSNPVSGLCDSKGDVELKKVLNKLNF